MGSFSLNDVLRSIGTPVRFRNAVMSAKYNGFVRSLTVCSRPEPS